jgi:hypothetical protein
MVVAGVSPITPIGMFGGLRKRLAANRARFLEPDDF